MTEIICELMEVPEPIPIEGADRIEARQIGGYTVINQKNIFKPGDLGLFISVDSVVPMDFLKHYGLDEAIKNGRVRTKKLRGVYSEGLFLPLDHPIFEQVRDKAPGLKLDKVLNIHKYEPPLKKATFAGQQATRIWVAENYHVYDIENIQNPHNRDIFKPEDTISIREKIHGMHSSYGFIGDQFFYTSRKFSLLEPEMHDKETQAGCNINTYYKPVLLYGLKEKLKEIQKEYNLHSIALRAEIFGHGVQELTYGLDRTKNNGIDMRAFDLEMEFNNYANDSKLEEICKKYDIPTAPLLWQGQFSFDEVEKHAELDSTVAKQNGIVQESEGVVIKDLNEGFATNNRYLRARRILKQVSKKYKASGKQDKEVLDE